MFSSTFVEFNSLIGRFLQKPSLTSLLRTSSRVTPRRNALFSISLGVRQLSVPVSVRSLQSTCRRSQLLGQVQVGLLSGKTTRNLSNQADDDFESSRKLLFVGRLPWPRTEGAVREYFSKFGEVDSVRMILNPRGMAKPFCFVKLKDAESVQEILQMNHKLEGSPLSVQRIKNHRVVSVDVPPGLSFGQLKEHCAQFGSVESVERPESRFKQHRNDCYHVTFASQEEAAKCVEHGDHEIGSFKVQMQFQFADEGPTKGENALGRAARENYLFGSTSWKQTLVSVDKLGTVKKLWSFVSNISNGECKTEGSQ